MRVLVVDDSAFMRKAISQALACDPGIEVVGTACNGQDALEKAKKLAPDVVTLDIEMPVMDGMAALVRIRAECPEPKPAVLMCSTLTSAGSHEALKALRLGAADVIAKDPQALGAGADSARGELIEKVKAVGEPVARRRAAAGAIGPAPTVARIARPAPARAEPGPTIQAPRSIDLAGKTFDLVVIGSSTGGPPVLETILTALPADFPCPLVVAQHMPFMFTKSMSERLDEMSAVTAVHAEDGMALRAGCVYMIPGGKHGRVKRAGARLTIEVSDEPRSALYRPSANELFASGAGACGPRCLGVMLTGMGDDGVVGARLLHAAGGPIIAQDAESCVVYGMPRAVVDSGLASAALPPATIAQVLARLSPTRAHGAAA